MRLTAAAAVPFFDRQLEFDGLDEAIAENLARDISKSVAELPRPAPAETREFAAETPAAARLAAAAWLQDFAAHGPLEIENIRTECRGDKFVALVTYRPSGRVAPGEPGEIGTARRVSEKPPADAPRIRARAPRPLPVSDLAPGPSPEVAAVPKLPRVTLLQIGGSKPS
ncbi:MAG TPA: hypothetical protein VN240_12390 [Propylenella sp.]|nr:hypothetical protein [Propylenella sp.]